MVRVYKRGRVYWVSYSKDGRQIRRSLKTRDKDIAEREANAIEAELLDPHLRITLPKNPEAGYFWEQYESWAREHRRTRTVDNQRASWHALIEFTSANRLGDISRDDIERFKVHLRDGRSPHTVNTYLKDVQAIFNRGIRHGWFTGTNPVSGIERYKPSPRRVSFHSREQLDALLQTAEKRSRSAYWVVLLGALGGLRKNEIANCQWHWFDFDPDRPMITVQPGDGFEIKDREIRDIPMHRRIYDALLPHRRDSGYLFEPGETNQGANRYRVDPKRTLIGALRDAGLSTAAPFQTLRRTFCTLHAHAGTPPVKLMQWAGHSDLKVTMNFYVGKSSYDADIENI